MFYHLKDGNPEIDGMMASVCAMGGGKTKLVTDWRWRTRDFPETAERARESLKTAKHQTSQRHINKAKTKLYTMQYNGFRALFERDPDAVAVAWNGLTGTRKAFMAAAKDTGTPHLFMERAPLPGRVTVDHVGVNQVNSLPREIGFYHDWAAANDGYRDGWRALKDRLTARKAEKRGDVGQDAASADLAATPFLFCPLQVPDDTQIKLFGSWVRSIYRFLDLIELSVPHLPDGWHIRFKEHPSSKIPLGDELRQAMQAVAPGKIVIDNSTDTFQQVAASRGVITLNSSVGLQSFWFDKPVVVLAEAFFRMPELITPVNSLTELTRLFAEVDTLTYDAEARAAFMNYLDRVYYPEVTRDGDRFGVAPDKVLPKIDAALATRRR